MQPNPYSPPQQHADSFINEEPRQVSELHSLECVQFVLRALTLAQRDCELSPNGIADAVGVCRVMLEMAVDHFGEHGKDKLIGWGINRSEDIGVIVYRLIAAQLIGKSENDSPADFSGLFDLNQPPESWVLKW